MNELKFSDKQIERFWNGVDRMGDDDCWDWTGHRSPSGYGRITIDYKGYRTNRLAWMVTNGPIPDGLFACHKCDNPACCNPKHLFLGTHDDNMRDMAEKGRSALGDRNGSRLYPERLARGDKNFYRMFPECALQGEKSPLAVLDDQTVRLIRFVYGNGGYTLTGLGKIFGVSFSTIHLIIKNKRWGHLQNSA